ncbi:hypothetical protein ABL78_7386 [Leptomonas seymouri]|uniref:Uncharacterized protein n=1 Tax=Leptomonas seymouri TaxID=5684 RepID=A0A0N1P9J6_LEPSE|nr:hypothetical protein ABL78_7386 [Leptomonas seymouri]|eukprot:KPI83583.1 hypothetical protein ABL78_7386 [Leptomonas seymouri]
MLYKSARPSAGDAWTQHASVPCTAVPLSYTQSTARPPYSQRDVYSTCTAKPACATAVAQTVASNPAMTIAQQKARYARAYVPPLELRQSQLDNPTQAHTYQTQGAEQQLAYPGVPSQFATCSAAQPCEKAVVQARATTRRHPVDQFTSSTVQPTGEWLQLQLSMQERQLACWKQLAQTQQQLTFELQGLREEVRRIRETLVERKTLTSPHKRPRGQCGDDSRADAMSRPLPRSPQKAESRTPSHPPRQDSENDEGKAGNMQRLMTVRGVRLTGGSTATSTQAFLLNDPMSGERYPADADAAFPRVRSGEVDENTSDAADSEADLFLL